MTKINTAQPTLVVLAAGMGSRYGGLKQIDPVGPSGETVIEYSIYDAVRSGFSKVVFVIREELEADFKNVLAPKFRDRIDVVYAHQRLDDVPEGCSYDSDRKKPWGTGHAVWAARHQVSEPFAVINADDFYGASSFTRLGDTLQATDPAGHQHTMIAFILRNTTSSHGPVSRGICRVDKDSKLVDVTERVHIEDHDGVITYRHDGRPIPLSGNEPVSMNMWGFAPTIFADYEKAFIDFLHTNGSTPDAEFFAPAVVDDLIKSGKATVDVVQSTERWLGITYPEDKERVAAGIRALVDEGIYPDSLWG